MTTPAPRSQLRSRLILLLIATMFFASFSVAAFLRFTGWIPEGGRNFGVLMRPPTDLSSLQLRRADGAPYPWAPQTDTWRIVVVPPHDCAQPCVALLDALHRVWLSQGRKADRIDVLWFGPLPAQAPGFRRLLAMQPDAGLTAALPEQASVGAVPVYLIDPKGFLALHYPAGFDPIGLRKDLGKLIK